MEHEKTASLMADMTMLTVFRKEAGDAATPTEAIERMRGRILQISDLIDRIKPAIRDQMTDDEPVFTSYMDMPWALIEAKLSAAMKAAAAEEYNQPNKV